MNKPPLLHILSINLFIGSLLASAVNDIDKDPWLRTWLFVGPFDDYEMAQKVSDSLSNSGFDAIIGYADRNKNIEQYKITSNSPSGKHAIYQYFPDSHDSFIIGFCRIESKENKSIYYNQYLHPWDFASFYLNDQLIIDKSRESHNMMKVSLKKGISTCRLISELRPLGINHNSNYQNSISIGLFGQNYITEISGKVFLNKSPIPNAEITIKNKTGSVYQTVSDEKGVYVFRVIKESFGDNFNIYCNKDRLKFSSNNINTKSNDQYILDLDLSDYQDNISGRVLTLYDDRKQSDILVQLINIKTNILQAKVFTDNSGKFEFQQLPKGKYQVFIESKQGNYYALNENSKNRTIHIGSNSQEISECIIKAPQINKGQWEQFKFIKGLKSDNVFDVFVDNENKIWFGCHTGLTIYDGNKYMNFGPKEGLSGIAVVKIFQDSKGVMWVIERNSFGGQGGVFIVGENYEITNFLELNGIPSYGFNVITEDSNGNIIFGGPMGLYVYDGSSVKHTKYGQGLGSGHVTDIFIDNETYWIATTDGLINYNGIGYNYFGIDEGLKGSSYVRKVIKSDSGNLLISTGHHSSFWNEGIKNFNHSLYTYDGLSFNLVDETRNTPFISEIIFSDDKMIYNSSNKIIIKEDNKLQTISPYWSKSVGMGWDITSIDTTKDGNLLFGTIAGGVWMYNARSVKTMSSEDGLPSNGWHFNLTTDYENNLWVNNGDGLYKIKDEKILKIYNKKSGFPTDNIRDVAIDNFGNAWVATDVGLINIVGDKFLVYDKKDGFDNINMYALSINANGLIWVSGSGFLSSMNGKEIKSFSSENDSIRIWDGNAGLKALDDGNVLFGGIGLKLLSVKEGDIKFSYLADGTWINGITVDSDENILYSSVNEGIVKFKNGQKLEVLNPENGMIYDVTTCVHIDNKGWIWTASESGGVGFYDGTTWSYINTDDGLLSNWVNRITSDNNGSYYFSHPPGVTLYKPLKQDGQVSFEKVSTTKNDYTNLSIKEIESIVNERIRFSFVARNYNNSQNKNKFKCSIVKDKEEIFTQIIDNPNFEWYPEHTGKFEFFVQSIDRDLNYSSPKVLTISILNPWYLRFNFLLPFLGFISLIIYTTFSSTSRYLKQKKFNDKLRLESQKKDKDARKVLEEKNKDLIESQKAAEAANEAKSTFLANMSHELRTPLNAIIGYSEMLIEDAEDENEDYIPDLDKINSSGKHLLGLINDILDLSKVESGKMELYLEEFDLQNIMHDIESTIKPLVEKNSNSFKLEYETKVQNMNADVTKVRQILLNLLSNSSKFTKNGAIKVYVKDSGKIDNGVEFIIEDTGIGMSASQVEKVFQPFTQADEKTTRKFGGTGLGLTITKMFAEMMGGMIDVTSVEGEGTTFTVTIPKVVNDDSSDLDQARSEQSDDKDYTVLVIDDDDSAQDMMKRFLDKQGYNVIQAKSGEMGLKLATEHIPDLITLDVMMPEMDGWEVLNTLQSNERSKKIPVIMLSMANEPDIGYSLGATDYLTKPVDWNELSNILTKHQIESDSQTVLIVEDDETTRQMLRKSLEINDFKVRSAHNGKDGLEKVKQFKPGLILLDLMMPEMDGFEFAERLREKKEWLDIPVVVITAKDLSKEDLARLKGNVETIMQKGSYSKDELLTEVGDRIKKLKGGNKS